MNYELMSNFEINKVVALIKFQGCIPYFDEGKGKSMVNLEAPLFGDVEFDPCNNPADAWPVIVESKITIIDLGNECMAMHDFQLNDDQYTDNVADWSLEARDKNPLRAAMIVFLMMNENKNDN